MNVPRSVSQKMGIQEGIRAHLVNAPAATRAALDLPRLQIDRKLEGEFGYIHLFAVTQAGLGQLLPDLKEHLQERGALWISWPKGGKLGTDLTLGEVIRIGYLHGLVESKTLAVDSTWSAMKFTNPIPGRAYKNSYGQLPDTPVSADIGFCPAAAM